MVPGLFYGGKDASRLHNIYSTNITLFDVGMISFLGDGEGLPIDKLLILSRNCTVEVAVGRVILEHVDLVVEVNEGVIVGYNIYCARVEGSPLSKAPNMAKSIHFKPSPLYLMDQVSTAWDAVAVSGMVGTRDQENISDKNKEENTENQIDRTIKETPCDI